MKPKIQKMILVILISFVLSFSLIKVYAQNTGVDLFALVQAKVLSIINVYDNQANTELDTQKTLVENNTLNYVDSYINGLDNELKSYIQQQKDEAKGKLDKNYTDIKNELDLSRQSIIDDAKAKAKQAIDAKYQEVQQQFNEDMNTKLTEKFK